MAEDRLFGLETEYAFSALGRNGEPMDRAFWCNKFMELAYARLRNLPDKHVGGVFLETGGRFYRDAGSHPELTTPEVATPWDACRYLTAGDRLLSQVADEMVRTGAVGQILLSRHNVSYGGMSTTWACHESYGHRAPGEGLPRNLIPHLVSRIVLTGAGGFSNRSPGIQFLISPRVAHLTRVSSDSSQSDRGIFHTKDETLADHGFHRLHILCGESLCSETSNWLKMATTALVVAMIENRVNPGDAVQLAEPLHAMQAFAADITLRHEATCRDGRKRTALAIQRHFLEQAERCQNEPYMPDWTPTACRLWRDVLDGLDAGVDGVARRLDWAIKLKLFQQAAARAGIEWSTIPLWNQVIERLVDALIAANLLPLARRATFRALQPSHVQPGSPIYSDVERLTPQLQRQGLAWERLAAVLNLRQQLMELDTRFSELGAGGIFPKLAAAGVLDHHAPGVDDIERAMTHPPDKGRAKLRGDCVRRFADHRGQVAAGWTGVWDSRSNKYLDLTHPLESTERWIDVPPPPAGQPPQPHRHQFMLRHLTDLYNEGKYAQAIAFLESMRWMEQPPSPHLPGVRRMEALSLSRLGRLSAIATLAPADAPPPRDLQTIADHICVHRFLGLHPHPGIRVWIERGLRSLQDATVQQSQAAGAFRDHYAAYLLSENRVSEAAELLAPFRNLQQPPNVCQRVFARMLVTLSEVDRRQGRYDESHRIVNEAERLQLAARCVGDRAEFTLPMKARLDLDLDRRLGMLHEARAQLEALLHVAADLRVTLLEARIQRSRTEQNHLKERAARLIHQGDALQQCPLAKRILENWDAWTSDAMIPGAADYFAGL